ncbi:unnamed protein product, partial [Ectocarpus sp. 12 AP-2014]
RDRTNKKSVKRKRIKRKKRSGDRASPSPPLPMPPPSDGMDAERERMGGRHRDKKSSKKKKKGEKKNKKPKRKQTPVAQTARSPTPTDTTAGTAAATTASCDFPEKRRNGAEEGTNIDYRQSTATGGCPPSFRNNPAQAQDSANATTGDAERPEDKETKAARARAMVPMRPEEYAAQQRTV